MAKLHGLTMGLDVCSTFHMGIEPRALWQLTEQIVKQAAPAYLMAVAGNTDPMLGYMTTSFREHPRLRRLTGKRISTSMQRRLAELGVMNGQGELSEDKHATEELYALYMKAGGDTRSSGALREEGTKKVNALRQRGYDLGYGHGPPNEPPPEVESRVEAIYRHARHALYATLDEAVIKDASPHYLCVRTRALDRSEYLSHPPSGEFICDDDISRLTKLYGLRRPQVQIVISDGLNANSLNENLRAVLPRLRHELNSTGYHVGEVDVVIQNGRVRAGYHAGELTGADVIIHLIGERPGTGLNTLSAYLTYGRDEAGQSRWTPHLDHSCTTAICGIHRQGKQPQVAVSEASRCVKLMFERRCSGVALGFDFG
jgi:ethanolamine ammonia-lyase large subunit